MRTDNENHLDDGSYGTTMQGWRMGGPTSKYEGYRIEEPKKSNWFQRFWFRLIKFNREFL